MTISSVFYLLGGLLALAGCLLALTFARQTKPWNEKAQQVAASQHITAWQLTLSLNSTLASYDPMIEQRNKMIAKLLRIITVIWGIIVGAELTFIATRINSWNNVFASPVLAIVGLIAATIALVNYYLVSGRHIESIQKAFTAARKDDPQICPGCELFITRERAIALQQLYRRMSWSMALLNLGLILAIVGEIITLVAL